MKNGLFSHIDWQLVTPVLILITFSLTTIFSINRSLFTNQLIFAFLSVGVFLFFSQIELDELKTCTIPIYIVSLILLFIVSLIGIQSRGAVRWIDIGGFRLQFSELLKPFLIFCFAAFLSHRHDRSFKTFGYVLAFLFPIAFLIYRQPDLGNALIYLGTVLLTLIIYGFPLIWFGIGGGMVAIGIPFMGKFLHEYQRQRLLTFFHLQQDTLGSSYNAIQSVIAVGSGRFFGKGLGLGTQSGLRFLPERHTDFLFATLSEDLGFVGALIVIIAFTYLFYRLFSIFRETSRGFDKLFIAGAFSLLLIQFFINVGMNVGIMPIVGVTLPFMSYGGSSLLSNAILLGCVSSIAHAIRKKRVLEIR